MDLKVGDTAIRTELHRRYGGRTQGGISPCAATPLIMLFANDAGPTHGYSDGWAEDTYLYTGEGQYGDQRMVSGNRVVRDHQAEGRALHLFTGTQSGKPVRYEGEFSYLEHFQTDAVDRDGALRRIYVFRLLPLRTASHYPSHGHRATSSLIVNDGNLRGEYTTQYVEPEEHYTELATYMPGRELRTTERREATLVKSYRRHLTAQGVTARRQRIVPPGELRPIYTDLYDPTRNELIEAKGSSSREAIRMALGQLLDYARFVRPSPGLAVLLPDLPRSDLVDLVHGCDATIITLLNGEWQRLEPHRKNAPNLTSDAG